MAGRDRNLLQKFEENREYMEERIQSGIEQNRKGYAKLQFLDIQGNPVTDVQVEVHQKTHDFRFGANIFMLDEMESEEKNEIYKKRFSELFNQATLPFFWADLEPIQGQPRYAKDCTKLYRRPSTDLCVEFCEQNGIEPKLHCLNYGIWTPKWVPKDAKSAKKYLDKHMEEIAMRYADRIPSVEVINETLWLEEWDASHGHNTLFYREPDYVEWSFEHARKYFPTNELIINEAPPVIWRNAFKYNRSAYYMLIERAISKGASIDCIGLQFQMGEGPEAEMQYYDPVHIYKVLDQYSKLGKALQISEVTIPVYSADASDQEIQAEIIENLYRIWFSHPSMNGIIYWNVADGYDHGVAPGDMRGGNAFYGGLLNFDLSPKPAYDVLKKLIHEEWKTNLSLKSGVGNTVSMKGFYGSYDIIATKDGKTIETELHLSKGGDNNFVIRFPS